MENINSLPVYKKMVHNIAANIVAAAWEKGFPEKNGRSLNADEVLEYINQEGLIGKMVHRSEYMTCAAGQLDILKFTGNENNLFERFGNDVIDDAETFNEVIARFAHWALYTDVAEIIDNNLESVMP